MKTLYIIPILAIVLAVAGCTSGSRGKTVNVIEPTPTETAETAPIETPVTVTVAVPEAQPTTTNSTRIDAVSFLDALVKSGCEIDKAEYKEVIRGGGIVVTCKGNLDPLELEGLEGL